MRRCAALAFVLLASAGANPCRVAAAPQQDVVTLTVVGTTDLHGYVFARNGHGGLALLGGYLRNLRAARAADGGAVVLIDAGDTFQGAIESNLSEGAIVIDAYEALGYTAAVIGNHEFDFGPVDDAGARQSLGTDPRGAIKAAAASAKFPFLAANLVDDATGKPVEWPNVHRSVLVEAAGVKVGIVGVMSIDALRATLPVNVQGVRIAPLAPAVAAAATELRAAGAQVVIVGAHAGGACADLSDPGRPYVVRCLGGDLSARSCAAERPRRRDRGRAHASGLGARGGRHCDHPGLRAGARVRPRRRRVRSADAARRTPRDFRAARRVRRGATPRRWRASPWRNRGRPRNRRRLSRRATRGAT